MQLSLDEQKKIHHEVPFTNRFISSSLFILKHIFTNNQTLQKIQERNIASAVLKMKAHGMKPGRIVQVDRRKNLSTEEFMKTYHKFNLPVIFEGEAQDWPCTKKWNIDYFANTVGETKIPLLESTGLVEKSMDQSKNGREPVLVEEISANHFVADLKKGLNKYLRFSLVIEQYPKLIEDFNQSWLRKMGPCYLGVGYQTFIGAAKRMTPIHAGPTAFFYIMVDGEKNWRLFSAHSSGILQTVPARRAYIFSEVNVLNPDLEKYPGFDLLTRYEAHLKKGDILYVPSWMWHEVENRTVSWGVSYRITQLRGFLRYYDLAFVRLFFSRPQFFVNLFNTLVLRKRTWAKLE